MTRSNITRRLDALEHDQPSDSQSLDEATLSPEDRAWYLALPRKPGAWIDLEKLSDADLDRLLELLPPESAEKE